MSITAIKFRYKDHDWGNGPGSASEKEGWFIHPDRPSVTRGRGGSDNSYCEVVEKVQLQPYTGPGLVWELRELTGAEAKKIPPPIRWFGARSENHSERLPYHVGANKECLFVRLPDGSEVQVKQKGET